MAPAPPDQLRQLAGHKTEGDEERASLPAAMATPRAKTLLGTERPAAPAAEPAAAAAPPMRQIPTFWVKKVTARSSLQAKLGRRAMAIFIERQSEELLAPEALRALLDWPMHRVNYDQFADMGRRLGPQCAEYFRAATFLHFERDRGGRISVAAFVGFVVRREELLRCRLHLSCYATGLAGFITVRAQAPHRNHPYHRKISTGIPLTDCLCFRWSDGRPHPLRHRCCPVATAARSHRGLRRDVRDSIVLKMMNFAFKMMKFAFEMMTFE